MTTDPTPGTPATPPPPTFGWGRFIGGILLAICVGSIGNIISGLLGASTGAVILAILIGAVPGVIFVGLSFAARKNGFAQGLLIGGCIIGLIGGACGAGMVGMSFH